MKMAQIVVLISCYIFLTSTIHESQCKMSKEERERDTALFEIFKTAMNRSLVPEDEYEDFLEANGVTIEILEEAIGAKSQHTKEETEDLLETVDKTIIEVMKSNEEQAKQLNDLTTQMNEFELQTSQSADRLREQIATSEKNTDKTRQQVRGLIAGPSRTSIENQIKETETQIAAAAAHLKQVVEDSERGMAEFRRRTMQFRYANEKSKERCEDFKQLAADLRVMLKKWPGESASLMDKAMNLVKHSHLVKRYGQITDKNLKQVQDELSSQDSDGEQLQIDSDFIPESNDVTPNSNDVISESDVTAGKDEL